MRDIFFFLFIFFLSCSKNIKRTIGEEIRGIELKPSFVEVVNSSFELLGKRQFFRFEIHFYSKTNYRLYLPGATVDFSNDKRQIYIPKMGENDFQKIKDFLFFVFYKR